MRTALKAFTARRLAERLARLLNDAEEDRIGISQDPDCDFCTGYLVSWRDGRATRAVSVRFDEVFGTWRVQ